MSKKEQSYYIHNVIVTAEFFILQRENTSRDKKPSTATNNLEGSGVAKEEEGVLRHFKEVTIHPRAPYWTTRRPCCCFYTRSAFQIENLPPPCFTNASDERTLSSILKALTLTTFVHWIVTSPGDPHPPRTHPRKAHKHTVFELATDKQKQPLVAASASINHPRPFFFTSRRRTKKKKYDFLRTYIRAVEGSVKKENKRETRILGTDIVYNGTRGCKKAGEAKKARNRIKQQSHPPPDPTPKLIKKDENKKEKVIRFYQRKGGHRRKKEWARTRITGLYMAFTPLRFCAINANAVEMGCLQSRLGSSRVHTVHSQH